MQLQQNKWQPNCENIPCDLHYVAQIVQTFLYIDESYLELASAKYKRTQGPVSI